MQPLRQPQETDSETKLCFSSYSTHANHRGPCHGCYAKKTSRLCPQGSLARRRQLSFWHLGAPFQPPTQALCYKSQDNLAQELDLAPGWGQKCCWVSIGAAASPATWMQVMVFQPEAALVPCRNQCQTLANAKGTVWAQCWVGINFACITSCTTSLEKL